MDMVLEVLLPLLAVVALSSLNTKKTLITSSLTIVNILPKLSASVKIVQRKAMKNPALNDDYQDVQHPQHFKTVQECFIRTIMVDGQVGEIKQWQKQVGLIVEGSAKENNNADNSRSVVLEWEERRKHLKQLKSRDRNPIRSNLEDRAARREACATSDRNAPVSSTAGQVEEPAKSAIAQLLTLCKAKEPTVFTTEKLGSL